MTRYVARYSAMATMTSAERAAHAASATNMTQALVWATFFDKCDATHARLKIAQRDARRNIASRFANAGIERDRRTVEAIMAQNTECQMPSWECALLTPADMTCATHSN